jgi:hypothetical protein
MIVIVPQDVPVAKAIRIEMMKERVGRTVGDSAGLVYINKCV